jgi:hypothetical protein
MGTGWKEFEDVVLNGPDDKREDFAGLKAGLGKPPRLPAGVEVMDVTCSTRNVVGVIIQHESFDVVPQGEEIPRIAPPVMVVL